MKKIFVMLLFLLSIFILNSCSKTYYTCKKCGGDGWVTCKLCGGSGKRDLDINNGKCGNCWMWNGRYPCTLCDGEGKLTEDELPLADTTY